MTQGPTQDDACFRLPVRIYWEDTDGAAIVYYANYLKFLERARTEWLRSLGYNQRELAQREGIAFVVRAINARFLRPARLDDELVVAVSRLRTGASLVEMKQTIARADELLFEADVELACVRINSFLPVRLPRSIRGLLADRSSGRPTIE